MSSKIRVALAGNPNAGKTTIFNNMTGGNQRVGNYPGVTVEKRTGVCRHAGYEIELTDLPGTYGLTAWSLDEKVARDFIINERPDLIVDVIDSSNLERNLYLTTQFMELGIPLVLAFNMSDVAQVRGLKFDTDMLAGYFGAPVVAMVGSKNRGTRDLLDTVVALAEGKIPVSAPELRYGHDIEDAVEEMIKLIDADLSLKDAFKNLLVKGEAGRRWLAIKALEKDPQIVEKITSADLLKVIDDHNAKIAALFGDSCAILLADRRYGYISGACQEAVKNTVEIRHTASDKIDAVITHRYLGLPIFMGIMYVVFSLTFTVGSPLMDLLEYLFGRLGDFLNGVLPDWQGGLVRSLIVDGVIGGVGGVLVFLPNIILLFAAIAVLEYSGYMARAAFVMDRLMHRIGLHGKSFIPMLIGFGCSVPAIMATRTLDSRRDRLITMLIIPLMSCGARIPIYTLIIPAFFPEVWHAPIMWMMYLIGIILAIICARLLGWFVFKEVSHGLVMELPPYRMPTVRCILVHIWERAWMYLQKAGTIILGVSVLMWVFTTFPEKKTFAPDITEEQMQSERMEYSVAGRVGRFIEPAIRPMGFDWKIGTALIGAVAAKEVFVSQLGVVYAVGGGDEDLSLREVLRRTYSPLTGLCIMLFCLIGLPCVATCAITRLESGSWKWSLFQFAGLTGLAYLITTLVYQLGSLII